MNIGIDVPLSNKWSTIFAKYIYVLKIIIGQKLSFCPSLLKKSNIFLIKSTMLLKGRKGSHVILYKAPSEEASGYGLFFK